MRQLSEPSMRCTVRLGRDPRALGLGERHAQGARLLVGRAGASLMAPGYTGRLRAGEAERDLGRLQRVELVAPAAPLGTRRRRAPPQRLVVVRRQAGDVLLDRRHRPWPARPRAARASSSGSRRSRRSASTRPACRRSTTTRPFSPSRDRLRGRAAVRDDRRHAAQQRLAGHQRERLGPHGRHDQGVDVLQDPVQVVRRRTGRGSARRPSPCRRARRAGGAAYAWTPDRAGDAQLDRPEGRRRAR